MSDGWALSNVTSPILFLLARSLATQSKIVRVLRPFLKNSHFLILFSSIEEKARRYKALATGTRRHPQEDRLPYTSSFCICIVTGIKAHKIVFSLPPIISRCRTNHLICTEGRLKDNK